MHYLFVVYFFLLLNLRMSFSNDERTNVYNVFKHKRALLSSGGFQMGSSGWSYSKREFKELFQKYRECLTNRKLKKRKTEGIKAILALEGQTVELVCHTCNRPDQDPARQHVFWQRLRMEDAVLSQVSSGKRMKINKENKLLIRSIDLKDAGQYYCLRGAVVEDIYQVDVLFREPQTFVMEARKDLLQPKMKLTDHNVEVFTHWSEWGDCDECGKVGNRTKFGTCMVQKINKNAPITPVDVPVMKLYPEGVPCRSTVLSKKIAHLKGIRDRKSEVIIGKCFRACPTRPPLINVTDTNGNVVSVVEASYHPLHEKPELPPMVIRKVMYEQAGIHLVLKCPTSKETSKVRWQRGERPINPSTIRHQTRGRVFVDRMKRLHIKRLRPKDTAAFNCWRWKTHIATLKVIVHQSFNKNVQAYISYGGVVLTFVTVIGLCCCTVCRRRRPRTEKK